jgi:hypothetical protein
MENLDRFQHLKSRTARRIRTSVGGSRSVLELQDCPKQYEHSYGFEKIDLDGETDMIRS